MAWFPPRTTFTLRRGPEFRALALIPFPVRKEDRMPGKRTTHRTSSGSKVYAVRDKSGKFKDVQSYKKAHGADVKKRSRSESSKKKK
jgi:hypothetical protein